MARPRKPSAESPLANEDRTPEQRFALIEGQVRAHCRDTTGLRPEPIVLTRLLIHSLRTVMADLDDFFASHGINDAAWGMLMVLSAPQFDEFNPSVVADTLLFARTHATRTADLLVKLDLVSRRTDHADRRRVLLKLTPNGRRLIEQLIPGVRQRYEWILAGWLPDEREQIEARLRQLLHHMSVGPTPAIPAPPAEESL